MSDSTQSRVYRQVNGPLADKLQRRSRRRLIVVLTVLAAAVVGFGIYTRGDRIEWMLLATVPFWSCVVLLNLSLRGIFELRDRNLDEQQIAVRNHAYKTAYGYTLVFMVLIATTAFAIDLDRIAAFSLAAFAFLTCALAPRLYTAWVMDDDDDDD